MKHIMMRKSEELPEQFFVLTRKGMRHVQKANRPFERKEVNSYGGLYDLKRESSRREYSPKFKEQYERQLMNERKVRESKRIFKEMTSRNSHPLMNPFMKRNRVSALKAKRTLWTRRQKREFEKLLNEHFGLVNLGTVEHKIQAVPT